MDEKFLSAEEAAEVLGISKSYLHSLVTQGKIPYRQVGGLLKFLKSDLLLAFPPKRGKADDK